MNSLRRKVQNASNLSYTPMPSRVKGVVHFKKKKKIADNLLTPISSKMSTSFFSRKKLRFLMKIFQDFLHIMDS